MLISIHALLAESDSTVDSCSCCSSNFYPRSPCGERPAFGGLQAALSGDFYPRSPCGERHWPKIVRLYNDSNFYPRSPCGERPLILFLAFMPYYFYPRSPCGERLFRVAIFQHAIVISIHALLAESDFTVPDLGKRDIRFLSTLSLRRATKYLTGAKIHDPDFYPRSPCGERLNSAYGALDGASISIHALLAESDNCSV